MHKQIKEEESNDLLNTTLENITIETLYLKLVELVEKSEDRIDRTNDLISYSFKLLDKITLEYTKQVENLQKVRDELLSQNKGLLTQIESMRIENENINKRYDSLLERMFIMTKNASENHINVN